MARLTTDRAKGDGTTGAPMRKAAAGGGRRSLTSDLLPSPEPHAPEDDQRLAIALRDLAWRVEHVRDQLNGPAGSLDRAELSLLLDTAEARTALGLGPPDHRSQNGKQGGEA